MSTTLNGYDTTNAHPNSGRYWSGGAYMDFGIIIHTFAMLVLVEDVILDYIVGIIVLILWIYIHIALGSLELPLYIFVR